MISYGIIFGCSTLTQGQDLSLTVSAGITTAPSTWLLCLAAVVPAAGQGTTLSSQKFSGVGTL